MIKASAVAGAAAWTAPVIIDSLASPAAAGSVCHLYYVKLIAEGGTGTEGNCYDADPACGPGRQAGTCSVCPSSGSTPYNPHPTLIPPGTGSGQSGYAGYYKIQLDGTSIFDSSKLNWSVMGNYEICHSGGGCTTLPSGSGIPSGVGYFVNGGTYAYVATTNTPSTTAYTSCYIYVQYCSTTPKTIGAPGNCAGCSPIANCGT